MSDHVITREQLVEFFLDEDMLSGHLDAIYKEMRSAFDESRPSNPRVGAEFMADAIAASLGLAVGE